MLGFYENFPINVHKIVNFTISISSKRLQQELTQALYRLNNETLSLEEITNPSLPQCKVVFEYGIGESTNFDYLDDEETNKVQKVIKKKPFQIMDFFCALRYYEMRNEKKTSLKFDYYMIRFTFNENLIGMHIFHERGPRYVSPEDLVNLVVNKINRTFSKRILKKVEPS